jgi:hypothetical protein
MTILWIGLLGIGATVVAYVQYSFLVTSRLTAAGMLLAVSAGFGWVCAASTASAAATDWLIFALAFAVVHLPALAILLIKRQRHRELEQ